MSNEKMREEFEEWVMSNRMLGATLWDAWQASRAALVVDLPKMRFSHKISPEYILGVRESNAELIRAIESLGLKVEK